MKLYTFKVLDKSGKVFFPKAFSWSQENPEPGTGLLDFEWTENIEQARKWTEKDVCLDIAFEYCNSELIEIETFCPFCKSLKVEIYNGGTNPGKLRGYHCSECNNTWFPEYGLLDVNHNKEDK